MAGPVAADVVVVAVAAGGDELVPADSGAVGAVGAGLTVTVTVAGGRRVAQIIRQGISKTVRAVEAVVGDVRE